MIEIIQAIEKRQLLKFKYPDDKEFRHVEVYILGINEKGNTLIRAFEKEHGWKLFNTAKMEDVTLTITKWHSIRAGYKTADKAFKKIVKRIN